MGSSSASVMGGSHISCITARAQEKMPGATMIRPEGTFLCWLDLSGLKLGDKEIFRRVTLDAAVVCVPGPWFGPGGEEHLRLNVGCPRSMLEEALERIRTELYR